MVEIIISMALLAIISAGIYNGYILLIKQTKEGQVKQTAALTGKKTIEEIKSINSINKVSGNITLEQDNKNIVLSATGDPYTLHLDKAFNICDDSNDYSYTEKITLKPVKDDKQDTSIDINNNSSNSNNKNILEDNLYLSKKNNEVYLRDSDNSTDDKKVESNVESDVERIYIYLETKNSNEKFLSVKDSQGNNLLKEEEEKLGNIIDNTDSKRNVINIYINFKDYKKVGSSDILKNVEINVSNKNEEENCETNIYSQKLSDVNVKVNFDEGQGYYNNHQAEDNTESYKIGALYDIKVDIKKKDSEDSLFTGYSTQNINVN